MVSTTVFVRYVRTALGLTLIVMLVLSQCAAVLGDLQPHESDDGGGGFADDIDDSQQAAGRAVGAAAAAAAAAGPLDPNDGGGGAAGGAAAALQPLHGNNVNHHKKDDNTVIVNNAAAEAIDRQHLHQQQHPVNQRTSGQPTSSSSSDDAAYANLGFVHGFLASLSVILVSELGDKTFFIAAIMAMRHPRLIVFVGAIGALGLMTVLSVVFGMAATIIPRVYTYYISTALFAIFGLKMLHDGWRMSPTDAQEELEEVQMDLKKREDELEKEGAVGGSGSGSGSIHGGSGGDSPTLGSATLVEDPESGGVSTATNNRRLNRGGVGDGFISCLTSRVLMQAFTMTFVAEWGDRSQLTTIILGAREDAYGVIVGGVLGHMMCTGLAVIGGRMIAQRISVRTVTLVGGVVFLVFALSSLFMSPNEEVPKDV